jgi:hypothetical protein
MDAEFDTFASDSNPSARVAIVPTEVIPKVLYVAPQVVTGLLRKRLNSWHSITLDTSCDFPLGMQAPSGFFYRFMLGPGAFSASDCPAYSC